MCGIVGLLQHDARTVEPVVLRRIHNNFAGAKQRDPFPDLMIDIRGQHPRPVAEQIRGLGPITLSVPELRATDAALTGLMNMHEVRTYPNPENAKDTVRGILDQFGWDTEDMGEAEAARAIEPLCMLWCIRGLRFNQWGHAFRLLK